MAACRVPVLAIHDPRDREQGLQDQLDLDLAAVGLGGIDDHHGRVPHRFPARQEGSSGGGAVGREDRLSPAGAGERELEATLAVRSGLQRSPTEGSPVPLEGVHLDPGSRGGLARGREHAAAQHDLGR